MILYNVTINIDERSHADWLEWMKEVHIPDVMRTGLFLENKICLIHGESEGGISYSVQYILKTMEDYNRYQTEFAPALQNEHNLRYNGRFAAFRTILEIVHFATP